MLERLIIAPAPKSQFDVCTPNERHPPGPPMDLANMRAQGVHHLICYCLNDSCRRQALIDVSSYPGDTPVPWFAGKVVCAKCRARGRRIDVAAELEGEAGHAQ
jgi:hypothetical protein